MRTPLRFLETLESRIQPAVNFSDDFNSFLVQPDTSKWAHYQQNVVGKPYNADWLSKDYNNANVKYTNTTSTLSIVSDAGALDGKALKMTLIRDPNSPTQFLSSEIATAIPSTFNIQSGTVQYGRIEVRAKLPGGPGASGYGVFPSFYLLGSNVNTGAHWPICGEIDVFENKGSTPGQIQSAIHGPGYTGHELTTTTDLPDGEAFYSAYHTFAVDWAPNAISFSLDGNIYKTLPQQMWQTRQLGKLVQMLGQRLSTTHSS